jgi:hypothetical protein
VRIFLKIVDEELIETMTTATTDIASMAFYSSSRKCHTTITPQLAYRYFAHYICIQALQNIPSESRKKLNPLHQALVEGQQGNFYSQKYAGC